MELWTEVRRKVLTRELSKRAACKQYGLHWQTLQKMLAHEEPPGYCQQRPRAKPKIEPFLPVIEEILKSDQQAPRKQRHTAKRIWERLRDEHGFRGGYTTVKDAVRTWRLGRKEVFLPLSHPPGEAQVDFGFAYVKVRGKQQQIALFVLSLPYSDAVYCQVFPRECTEVFLEGHRRAFTFIGGVPRRIAYDNTKTAVAQIVGARERKVTREFQRLLSHYLFESHFCLVRRPNEKGHVERLLDYARENFLVPVPEVQSLEQLNQSLEDRCRQDLSHSVRGKSGTKEDLLAEDRAAFLALPVREFEARRVTAGVAADSLSLVRFDTNSYSVPTKYAHRKVTVVATVDEVRLIHEDQLLARHVRCWERERTFYEPVHYLALLERKPGGLDYARPLEGWHLPPCFDLLRRRLEADDERHGTRAYIRVLRLLEHFSLEQLTDAVEYALDIDVTDWDSIRVIVEHRADRPVEFFSLDGRPELQRVRVETTNVSAYQVLLMEVLP
jgi:transposase